MSTTLKHLELNFRSHQSPILAAGQTTIKILISSTLLILFSLTFCSHSLTSSPTGNSNDTFVGIGSESDLKKLEEDYGFGDNANTVDLGKLAADRFQIKELKNLARFVIDKEVEKPKRVTLSRWDYEWLTPMQVQYACVDACVSYEIGRILKASG